MKDLLLIRHAEPARAMNAPDQQTLDIGGKTLAKSKAKQLTAMGYNFDVMGASEIPRAQDTANAMGARELFIHPLLNEIDPGIGRYVFANMLAQGTLPKEIHEMLLSAGELILDELVPEIPEHIDGCVTHASGLAAVKIARLNRENRGPNLRCPNLVVTHLGYITVKR